MWTLNQIVKEYDLDDFVKGQLENLSTGEKRGIRPSVWVERHQDGFIVTRIIIKTTKQVLDPPAST